MDWDEDGIHHMEIYRKGKIRCREGEETCVKLELEWEKMAQNFQLNFLHYFMSINSRGDLMGDHGEDRRENGIRLLR
jgi:hypothetical protein